MKIIEVLSKRHVKFGLLIVSTIMASLIAVLFFLFKPCEHQWLAATCDMPKTCSLCAEIEGQALKHKWKDATCETAVTCELCGEVAGKALGHQWQNATCNSPQTCLVCDKTKGKKIDHKWEDATYEKPRTCSICGKTSGSPLVKNSSNSNNGGNSSPVGTYQMSYLDDSSTVTECLIFRADGSVIHKCSANEDDGHGTWSVSGSTIKFTLYEENYKATIVSKGIMWGSSFLNKIG